MSDTTIDDILFYHKQRIDVGDYKEAKSALYDLILKEVVGSPEPFIPALTQPEHWGLTEGSIERVLGNAKSIGKNQLKAEQIKKLKELFDE